MPQLCSQPAANPARLRTQPLKAPRRSTRRGRRVRRLAVQPAGHGPPLSILGAPSPTLGDTYTSCNEMRFWVGWFARFHSAAVPYVPYEIKTLARPVVLADGSPVLRSDGQPQWMRYVREVAHREVNGAVEWTLISWDVGRVSVTFHPCASLDEAMVHYNAPPAPICRC